jgi:hypothetical protein
MGIVRLLQHNCCDCLSHESNGDDLSSGYALVSVEVFAPVVVEINPL